MEEQLGVMVRRPLLAPSVLEVECAGDPELARLVTNEIAPLMQPPAVTQPRASKLRRDDLAGWCHPFTFGWNVVASLCSMGQSVRGPLGCAGQSSSVNTPKRGVQSTDWWTCPSRPLTTIQALPELPFVAPTAPVKLSLPKSVR